MNTNDMLVKVATMPELRHAVEGEEVFDIEKSAAVAWLIQQPEVKNWMFFELQKLGCLAYNPETKCWSGQMGQERVVFTEDQIFEVLREEGDMKFQRWRLKVETKFGKKSAMWDFIRTVDGLTDKGLVFKVGSFYRSAAKKKIT